MPNQSKNRLQVALIREAFCSTEDFMAHSWYDWSTDSGQDWGNFEWGPMNS